MANSNRGCYCTGRSGSLVFFKKQKWKIKEMSELVKVLCMTTVLAYVFLAEDGKRDLLDDILLAAMGIALKRQTMPCVVERRNEKIM